MQPKIIILTAPSGAGKTSIVRHLLSEIPQLCFSISAATRQPRTGEIDGKDYYFITPETFQYNIEQNAFVEWEMVYEGKYYGTLRSELERIWAQQQTPLVDIDVKGAIAIQRAYRNNCLSLFIQPPSIEELKKRLIARGTETEKSLQERLAKAAYEMSFRKQFDAIVINDILAEAQAETSRLITAFLQQ